MMWRWLQLHTVSLRWNWRVRALILVHSAGPASLTFMLCPIHGAGPCCRYCDEAGAPTEQYPFNPNGSPSGIAALCSHDGRHLAMMPHPERCFLTWQQPWYPQDLGLKPSGALRLNGWCLWFFSRGRGKVRVRVIVGGWKYVCVCVYGVHILLIQQPLHMQALAHGSNCSRMHGSGVRRWQLSTEGWLVHTMSLRPTNAPF
jgi:hypothetical protein